MKACVMDRKYRSVAQPRSGWCEGGGSRPSPLWIENPPEPCPLEPLLEALRPGGTRTFSGLGSAMVQHVLDLGHFGETFDEIEVPGLLEPADELRAGHGVVKIVDGSRPGRRPTAPPTRGSRSMCVCSQATPRTRRPPAVLGLTAPACGAARAQWPCATSPSPSGSGCARPSGGPSRGSDRPGDPGPGDGLHPCRAHV